MNIIELSGVTKTYGTVVAVDDLETSGRRGSVGLSGFVRRFIVTIGFAVVIWGAGGEGQEKNNSCED